MDNTNIDVILKNAALRIRKIREMKDMTRDKFCEPLGVNSDYLGLIERGEQAISLPKLLLICRTYSIPIESIIDIKQEPEEDLALKEALHELIDKCNTKQVEIIKKFVESIAMTI